MSSEGHINFSVALSSDKALIDTRSGNAVVSGLDYGWFKIDYDSASDKIRVRLYANQNDSDYDAGSAEIDASTLPQTISLTDNSGKTGTVTATITIDGVR